MIVSYIANNTLLEKMPNEVLPNFDKYKFYFTAWFYNAKR